MTFTLIVVCFQGVVKFPLHKRQKKERQLKYLRFPGHSIHLDQKAVAPFALAGFNAIRFPVAVLGLRFHNVCSSRRSAVGADTPPGLIGLNRIQ